MEQESLFILLAVFLVGCSALTEERQLYFHASGLPVDKMVPAILAESSDTSEISCAGLCIQHLRCTSFTLAEGNAHYLYTPSMESLFICIFVCLTFVCSYIDSTTDTILRKIIADVHFKMMSNLFVCNNFHQ